MRESISIYMALFNFAFKSFKHKKRPKINFDLKNFFIH